jgi:signal transduction histidine kinase
MPLELAELAAGLPLAASFAMAGGISALREGRRRTALNEAMHELRRPLQVIAFLAPGSAERGEALESSVRMAAAAVDRLDCEINGRSISDPGEAAPLRPLVESAVERWRPRATGEARALNLKWMVEDSFLFGGAVGLAQAMDNLINNALTHGRGEVTVEVKRVGGVVRLVVLNRKRAKADRPYSPGRDSGPRLSGRRRHGHGLRIVRRVAVRNGGSFRFDRRGERCEAVLELPLPGRSQ